MPPRARAGSQRYTVRVAHLRGSPVAMEEDATVFENTAASPVSLGATTLSLGEDVGAIEDPDVLFCCSCHRETPKHDSIIVIRSNTKVNKKEVVRCRKCHALRARIDRLVARRGELEDWAAVSKEDKQKFYKDCRDECGDNLLVRMQECIMHSTTRTSMAQFATTGTFLDLDDLTAKYKTKPAQLDSIIQNARKVQCPVKRVTLYEDIAYSSTLAESEERVETKKRKVDMTEAPQPKAKAKANKPTGRPDEEGDGGSNKIPAAQKKKIVKKLELLTTTKLQLSDFIAKANARSSLVPAYVIRMGTGAIQKIDEVLQEGNEAVNIGHGETQVLLDSVRDATDKGNEATAKLKLQIEEAERFLADADGQS